MRNEVVAERRTEDLFEVQEIAVDLVVYIGIILLLAQVQTRDVHGCLVQKKKWISNCVFVYLCCAVPFPFASLARLMLGPACWGMTLKGKRCGSSKNDKLPSATRWRQTVGLGREDGPLPAGLARAGTHVDNGGGAAVQVLVEVVEDLPQLLHILLVGLQQHGLEVHGQPVPAEVAAPWRQGYSRKPLLDQPHSINKQVRMWTLSSTNKNKERYLRTDSTNTLSAFMWIQAMNASLKFTFSHRTSGPYWDGVSSVSNTLRSAH